MNLTRLPAHGARGIDRYSAARITDVDSFDELLSAFDAVAQQASGPHRWLLTLDDLGQCLYTSGHARNKHGFDDDIEYPVPESDETLRSYEEQVFAASLVALHTAEDAVSWAEMADALVTVPEDIDALLGINVDPDVLVDSVHIVQQLPGDDADAPLANLPNGYFEGDLTPFQCLALAQRLREQHGYELFGIGAATLGFRRSQEGAPDVTALVADLQHVYGQAEAPAWHGLIDHLRPARILVLPYTEGFAEILG